MGQRVIHRTAKSNVLVVSVQVDQSWREIMDVVQSNPNCLVVGQDKEKLAALEDSNRLLEEIQKVRFETCQAVSVAR
jgi:hypothetical protein